MRRLAGALGRVDGRPGLVNGTKALRTLLPGDPDHGDPLSVAGNEPSNLIGQRIAQATNRRPSALREVGFGALQMWQALSEAQGRGRGNREMTIVFTDLVEFSDWALEAGDEAAIDLLRDVGRATETPVGEHDGEVVKRLGDGMMAVFGDAPSALDALVEARERLREVEAKGYRPQIRAGIHVGRPRRIGGDYIGVDVNVAARVAEEASGDEILVTDRACEALSEETVKMRRKRRFKVKGVPSDLGAHTIERA